MMFGVLYPVKLLNVAMFPALAALRALVADGALGGLLTDCLFTGRNLNAFARSSPTIIMEFSLKFSAILAMGRFFDEARMSTFGNHVLRIFTLSVTDSGFFLLS